MSIHETPTQHNSTLVISPFITGNAGSKSNGNSVQANQVSQASTDEQASAATDPKPEESGGNWGEAISHSPYQSIANSPLVQKMNPSVTAASLATPYHNGAPNDTGNGGNGILTSISKNSLFGSTIPSTLRKVSLQREYKDPTAENGGGTNNEAPADGTGSSSRDEAGNNQEGMGTTTLTTTTTTTATSVAEFDISELSSIEKLRLWRHDALMQHLYKTAEFIGNKIYTMTGDPNDAFWLAQVFYSSGACIRAVELLTKDMLDSVSIMCRYLLALCLVDLQRYEEALDVVGESNPFYEAADQDAKKQNDGGIKLESSLCYLRGKIYAAQNNFNKSKESYKEAVLVDVKNYEALEELIAKNLLTPKEEWDLLDALEPEFTSLDDNQEMVKYLYTIRLSKYLNEDRILDARRRLIKDHNLESNVDVLRSQAEIYCTQCKFTQCLEICEIILERDEFNGEVLPLYISCLYELGAKNKLFLLSHKLAENFAKNSITWFSVATYYMVVEKIEEARKYFSKSSILDPNFTPAWLGFAHTYAIEGEQDQAISAYSTAARFFPGIHLPNLFLGMQYMALNTFSLAEEYFTLAYDTCPQDPLLLNEMGVMYFKRNDLHKAKRYLKRALEAVKELNPTSRTSVSIQMNLAHAYRRLGENERAIRCFKTVLEVSNKDSDTYCSLGFLYLKIKELQRAIDHLHTALSLKPSNLAAQELLLHALELNVSMNLDSDHPLMVNSQLYESNFDQFISSKKRAPKTLDSVGYAKRMRKTHSPLQMVNDDDAMDLE